MHNSYLITLVPCEICLTHTPFSDAKMITYEIELTTFGNKIGFNLLDKEDFTIPFIIDEIKNSPDSHQLVTQANNNMWIISKNGEEPIKEKGSLEKYRTIKLNMVNKRSRLIYSKGKSTSRQILNTFGPDLIKSDPWFHISNFFSQKIL